MLKIENEFKVEMERKKERWLGMVLILYLEIVDKGLKAHQLPVRPPTNP